jgi:RNA polymerase sigma-70 factor (ECF subfamily)
MPGDRPSDSEMIERVIRDHGALLDRVAWGYARNAHDRDDLMQEILVALWRALPRFRGDSSERSFVSRRRHQAEPELDQLPDPAPIAEARMIGEQQHDRLLTAIRRLPESQRQAVMLRLEGLSQREIADMQNTTESNVGVRLTRARKTLRALLVEEEP